MTPEERVKALIAAATDPPPESLQRQYLVHEAVKNLPKKPDAAADFWPLVKAVFVSAWPRFKWFLVATVLMSAVSSGLNVWSPRIMKQITDLLISPHATEDVESKFFWLLFAMAAAKGLFITTNFITTRMSFYIATQTEDSWRYAGIFKFFTLPMEWHDQQDSGQIGGRVERGGAHVWGLLNNILGQDILINTITLMAVLVAALWSYPPFWWIFIVPIPIHLLSTHLFTAMYNRKAELLSSLTDGASRTLYDGLANVKAVKTFGRDWGEAARYAGRWSAYHKLEYDLDKINFNRISVQQVLESGLRFLLLGFCYFAIVAGDMTVGTMTMLLNYQMMILTQLTSLNSLFSRSIRTLRRITPLIEMLRESDTLPDKPDAIDLPILKSCVELKNIDFYYGTFPALKTVNLKIEKGTTVALVGRSGAGKSTTTSLLLRFFDPQGGQVLWDGIDIRDVTRKSMRRLITMVPQETTLFNRSIRENIAYGRPDATMDEIVDAAKKASAHDFIMELPEKYETQVGERGSRLSGGQRQRVAIARVFLLQPSLLLLDESTSNLDTQSESAIQDSFKALGSQCTMVVIAHRLSTIIHADKIVVLDDGRIVGEGPHPDLLRTCPIYKMLHDMQFKEPVN